MPAIDISIHGQEGISLVQLTEERTLYLLYTCFVVLEVIPRLRVGQHVPAHGIGTILLDVVEGVDGVAQALGHLQSVLVQDEAIADNCLVRYTVEDHRGNGMQGEEPTTRLVNTLGNEVGRIDNALVQRFLILKGIVNLGVGHSTAVKPHVDEVELTLQRLTTLTHEDDVIDIGTVKVYAVVVLLTHVAHDEAFILQWIVSHETCTHALLYFIVEFFHRADADFLASVTITPDGQWCAPIAATAEVPVVEVLEPFAKASRAR